jgi:rhodanese-related sulfurtransferase
METYSLVKEICPTTTQKWIRNGALLVDVREKDESSKLAFDVPNIINIPLSNFEERFQELANDQDIIVVGADPLKSLRAAGFLVNHGYKNVVNMKFGLERWVQKGFPTKGDISVINERNSCCSSDSCC